jgi:PKD repeat protein
LKTKGKDIVDSESAVASVIAAIMIIAIVFAVIIVIRLSFLPEWRDDAEASHMHDVLEDMGNLRSTIDTATYFKSVSIPSESSTVQVRMGGGEVPFLDPMKSSGALSVNMDPCSAYLTLKDKSGNVIYSEPFDCGGVTYSSNNRQFVNQALRYENGALILAQRDRSVMRQYPSFSINSTKIDAGNDTYNFSASINIINISGTPDSISSDTVESLRVLATDFEQVRDEDSTQVDTFNYTVFTKYPNAWEFYFNETAKNVGLIYKSDFNITESLFDRSKDLYSVSFNFLHTDDKHLDNMYVNRSTVDVERGNIVKTTTKNITSLRQPPTPGFSFTPSTGTPPLDIQIIDESYGAKNYSYNFGDGSDLVNVSNPTHTYEDGGTYNITQTVTNSHGSTSITKSIRVKQLPIAYINTLNTTNLIGFPPHTVEFTDVYSDATEWHWDFGDGTTANTRNVTHTYNTPGTYTVTLTAVNEDGQTNDTITVTVQQHPPVANFIYSAPIGSNPWSITFTDTSLYSPTSWKWNFGDKTAIVTTQNVTHKFTSKNNYTVTLTVTRGTLTDSKSINVVVK